ncbi:MAG: large conductance mechanosensitive channel protein MscL [Atopobium sp.]|uniref:large conductance mechanosensitive channel protein MscL n=1 Tax=Atopobium sp. TaxID=1872650 RepID=UPI002A761E9C|nr:large conductance mechanosensitive channel protein MscL [Atopobium sp.]MDY2788303.1 large conductance mechanosensitive channel protein MscL [Atopobium sp.]MDY4522940.1 large conductance mechanosensitive channel protein MscL [Atopobium sp.]
MKKFLKEFGEFINRGNMMDMAVGVIIGGGFTAIVTALINYIINPLITAATHGTGNVSGLAITIPGSEQAIDFGAFIGAVINFLITAFVVFLLLRAIKSAQEAAKMFKKEEAAAEETPARTCPYCKTEIAQEATRCPHCTSILPNASSDEVAHMSGTNA